jgi:antitoxin ParD1/3/4
MSNTTSINLGDHFTDFIGHLTQSGRYGSASEAVRAALRLLEEEESKYQYLTNALADGENSGESSRTLDDIVESAKSKFYAKRL